MKLLHKSHNNSTFSQIGCRFGVEFTHKSMAVVFNRSFSSIKLLGNLFIGVTSDNQFKNFHFTSGQRLAGLNTNECIFQKLVNFRTFE